MSVASAQPPRGIDAATVSALYRLLQAEKRAIETPADLSYLVWLGRFIAQMPRDET